jgi:hypothetical protein
LENLRKEDEEKINSAWETGEVADEHMPASTTKMRKSKRRKPKVGR